MRKVGAIIFAAIIFFAAFIFLTPEPEGFPILEYHRVTNNPEFVDVVYNVTPDEFSAQLDYLQQNGYTTITLQDFMRVVHGKGNLPDKPIILTFDDGYEDNYKEMLPILESHGMTGVIYVVSNFLGTPGYMTLEQAKDLQRRGVEVGSHTANHLPLTELSEEKREEEIGASKLFLEWKGFQTIYGFSYPNGKYNPEMQKILERNDYLTAVTGEPGLNTTKTNPYFLKRIHIRKPRFGITEFKLRLLKAKIFAKISALTTGES